MVQKRRLLFLIIWVACLSVAFFILVQLPFAANFKILSPLIIEKETTTTIAPTTPKRDIFFDIFATASKMDVREVPVLMTFLEDDSLDFANNWLCNVEDYGLYQNVIMISASEKVKQELTRLWPTVHVFSIEKEMSPYQDRERHLRCNKFLARAVLTVLEAELKVLLFRVDSVWLQDPIVLLQSIINNKRDVNLILAGFSERSSDLDTGFALLKAVPEVMALWNQYIVMIDEILKRIVQPNVNIPESENERNYFSQLVRRRFGRVKHHLLTVDIVADDRWYGAPLFRTENTRYNLQNKLHVVRNYFADTETLPRKQMMKDARHWFIEEAADWACNEDSVVQAEKSVWRL